MLGCWALNRNVLWVRWTPINLRKWNIAFCSWSVSRGYHVEMTLGLREIVKSKKKSLNWLRFECVPCGVCDMTFKVVSFAQFFFRLGRNSCIKNEMYCTLHFNMWQWLSFDTSSKLLCLFAFDFTGVQCSCCVLIMISDQKQHLIALQMNSHEFIILFIQFLSTLTERHQRIDTKRSFYTWHRSSCIAFSTQNDRCSGRPQCNMLTHPCPFYKIYTRYAQTTNTNTTQIVEWINSMWEWEMHLNSNETILHGESDTDDTTFCHCSMDGNERTASKNVTDSAYRLFRNTVSPIYMVGKFSHSISKCRNK